jgi:hypothetical protein
VRIHGQRWLFRIGNSVVKVDNAFSWTTWTQERLIVNDEVVRQTSGWMRIRQTFTEPWLTMLGEEELRVKLVSRASAIACAATLGEAPLEPDERLSTSWNGGTLSWPAEEGWQPDSERSGGRSWLVRMG